MQNRQVRLKKRPEGEVVADCFDLVETQLPELKQGDILAQNIYLSVDPYMRGRMDGFEDSYVPPFPLAAPFSGYAVVKVIESRSDQYQTGDYLCGMFNWEEYSLWNEQDARTGLGELVNLNDGLRPLSYYIGLLGMPGQTAWVGMQAIGKPKAGETVFVSAASGAVGSVVGQIAKNAGCHVVGCAGSNEKVDYLLNELNFDAAFNYHTVENLDDAIAKACPDGIDINFENVGGPIMHAVFQQMNAFSRFILCGLISDYDPPELNAGPPLMSALVKRIRIQGFIVMDFPELCPEWVNIGTNWLQENKLHYRESVVEGIECAPQAMIDVLKGRNFGKQIVKLTDE